MKFLLLDSCSIKLSSNILTGKKPFHPNTLTLNPIMKEQLKYYRCVCLSSLYYGKISALGLWTYQKKIPEKTGI